MRQLTIVNLIDIKNVSINDGDEGIKGIYIELPFDSFILFTERAFEDVIVQVDKIRQKKNEQDTS